MRELEPVKATAKGNLPLAIAKELHDSFNNPSSRLKFPIRSEEESLKVNSLRHILRMCGWIKKVKNNFSLTRKGRIIPDKGFSTDHFFILFNVFTRKFNWAFLDGYPSFSIIQQAFLFSLYLLYLKAENYIDENDLGDYFIKAFPFILSEAEGSMAMKPVDNVRNGFSLRFLERFCEYFAFVDIRREKKSGYGFHLFVQTNDFFKRYINWSHIS